MLIALSKRTEQKKLQNKPNVINFTFVLRVVFDTNVYISAFLFGRVNENLIRLAEDDLILVYLSPPIVREIRRIMQSKFSYTTEQMKLPMTKLERIGHIVNPRFRLQVLDDRADNRILECAVAARADIIVSGDLALQKLGQYERITILSPKEFLNQFNSKGTK